MPAFAGSFDSINTSLREALIPLRMTLPMTSRTAGNVRSSPQLILVLQSVTQRQLVHIFLAIKPYRLISRRLLIPHIEYLIARAQILLWIAMTVQTPFHLQ